MNFGTAPYPYCYFHYYPQFHPGMEYYRYQAPHFPTYMEGLPKKEEQCGENLAKTAQIQNLRTAVESKTKDLPEKKMNSSTCIRTQVRKNEGDQEYQQRKQTPQRNTLSNTIKYFLRYVILKPQLAKPEVKKILETQNLKYDSEEFLRAFEQQFSGKMNYISKECIENIWLAKLNSFSSICVSDRNQFCLVFRILFHRYFERIIFEERLADKKKKKKFQLRQKKYIKGFLKELQNKLKNKKQEQRK